MSACAPLDVGCWIDDPPRLVLGAVYLERLRALELSHVCVMVDGPKAGLSEAKWRHADLARLAAALPGTERVLSVWGSPQREHVDALGEALPALLAALGSRTVELDLEPAGGWRSRDVSGYVGLADAGRALVETCRRAGARRVEVTTFPGALPGAAGAVAAADALAVQAYAVARRDGQPIAWDGELGPVRYPGEGCERAARRFPGVEIVAGLAAYKQDWAGHQPGEAMRAAVASAADVGVKRVRYWSAKWLCRLASRRWAAPAVAGLSAR